MLYLNSLQKDKLPTLVIEFLDMENVSCSSCSNRQICIWLRNHNSVSISLLMVMIVSIQNLISRNQGYVQRYRQGLECYLLCCLYCNVGKKSSSKGLPRWRSGKTQLSMQKIEETQVLGRDPLEKEMAKPSCILAQKSQTGESGGLLSMRLQRVKHD